MTAQRNQRIRAAALRRSLATNAECQFVLRGRPISDSTINLLKKHFERQPGSEIRNRILGNIGALIWLHHRLSLRLLAGGLTRGQKMLNDAEKHAYETALAEFERLVGVTTSVLAGAIDDLGGALNDILMLEAILNELDRRGVR